MFDGLVMQGQPDGSSVRNIFEGSFTKEGTGAVNDIFEGVLIFSASEAREDFDSTSSKSRERKTGLHIHPLKRIKNWRVT